MVVSLVCLKKMRDETVILSHMQNKAKTDLPDFHHTVKFSNIRLPV